MFDIGFTELLMIGIVALVVIGPERLPKVARTAGHLYGRMQRYVSSVKSDISQEIQMDELRQAGQDFKESVESAVSNVEQEASVVDGYLRNETANIGKAMSTMTVAEDQHSTAEADTKSLEISPAPQQSLPLDEPDQNAAEHTPSAVVEPARGETAGTKP